MKFKSRTEIEIQNVKSKCILVNAILNEGLSYSYLKTEDTKIKIEIFTKDLAKYEKILNENNIEYKISEPYGTITVIKKYQKKVGLVLGAFVFLVAVFISSKQVWSIEIIGNERVSDKEIKESLSDAGLRLGTFIPGIDYDSIHNRVLLNSKELSWISVNISGNVARVEVKERLLEKKEEAEQKYSNLVANNDGQIASIMLIAGEKVISIGDVVKKGQLLVSGVLDSQSHGVVYTDAQARVFAYVNKEIKVKIPLKNTEKVYTGKVYEEKNVFFYSNEIKIHSKYRNPDVFYDTIVINKEPNFFGIKNLPFYTQITKYYEYFEKEVLYTKEQAVNLAFKELRSELDVALENAELISKTIETSSDADYVYVSCQLYCIEDIAKKVEFTID